MSKIDKNKDGKFAEGNKAGKKFSATNPPVNPGRKPSRFKQIISQLEEANAEPLSKEDYSKIIAHLLTLTPDELKKLTANKATPIAVLVVASAIAGDIENKGLNNVERLIDRLFGKSLITQEIKTEVVEIGYK